MAYDVQNEETVIFAKIGKDLFNISKVMVRKTKWPRFFGLPCKYSCFTCHRQKFLRIFWICRLYVDCFVTSVIQDHSKAPLS